MNWDWNNFVWKYIIPSYSYQDIGDFKAVQIWLSVLFKKLKKREVEYVNLFSIQLAWLGTDREMSFFQNKSQIKIASVQF